MPLKLIFDYESWEQVQFLFSINTCRFLQLESKWSKVFFYFEKLLLQY